MDNPLSKQIYKYFSVIKNMALNNISAKNKEKMEEDFM